MILFDYTNNGLDVRTLRPMHGHVLLPVCHIFLLADQLFIL